MADEPLEAALDRAAAALDAAQALLVTAGAGMGVDAGLPDFRGPEGFWRAYPPLAKLGLRFEEMAQPRWFRDDPALAWGFYGHRLNLYRATPPHAGYARLLRWADQMPGGAFVYTSNVDGHFAAAGFSPERILECHGSLHHFQCVDGCGQPIWSAPAGPIALDEATLRASEPLPACPRCGRLARPNVLLFEDRRWDIRRAREQETRMNRWWQRIDPSRLTVIECGAGRTLATVRWFSEHIASMGATLIRINPRDYHLSYELPGAVALPMGAGDALARLGVRLGGAP